MLKRHRRRRFETRATASFVSLLALLIFAGQSADAQTTVSSYDADGDGAISKAELITAINDYLFGESITKREVIEIITHYLFGPSPNATPTPTPIPTPETDSTYPLVYGPVSGKIDHQGGDLIDLFAPDVSISTGAIRVIIDNPDQPEWSVGLRLIDLETHHWVIVDSDGRLSHYLHPDGEPYRIAAIDLAAINVAPGGANTLEVHVGTVKWGFYINNSLVRVLDLNSLDRGIVQVGTNFFEGQGASGGSTTFRDLQIWRKN